MPKRKNGETRTEVKARGGFYTPDEITEFLSRWGVREGNERVLEPACGDGAFIKALATRFHELGRTLKPSQLVGVERYETDGEIAQNAVPAAKVVTEDFFALVAKQKDRPEFKEAFDLVIGNPPYIRYHNFRGPMREQALQRTLASGVTLSNLASSWAHFLIHAGSFLKADGRLGMVLPSELLHTDYAKPVRAWLEKRFSSLTLVAFDKGAFPEAQIDALLLLADSSGPKGLHLLRIADAKMLAALDTRQLTKEAAFIPGARWSGLLDTQADVVYQQLAASEKTWRLGEIAKVDIGVVTGANRFFVLSKEDATRHKIPGKMLVPIVSSPKDLKGMELRASETRRLLLIKNELWAKEKPLATYLKAGVALHIPDGYKCRTRKPWYRVPLPRTVPDGFLPYMNHHSPRIIVSTGAWSTNLVHGVSLKEGAPDIAVLALLSLSMVCRLSAEIEGRAYGGGVLKLETKEAERLLLPKPTKKQVTMLLKLFPAIDRMVAKGEMDEASRIVDQLLGVDHLGLEARYQLARSRRIGHAKKIRKIS